MLNIAKYSTNDWLTFVLSKEMNENEGTTEIIINWFNKR